MNILAIDYGKKRLGLAWCDTAIGVVLPYGVIETRPTSPMGEVFGGQALDLADLIKKERVEKVIMGLPLGLDGKENANTKIVREFAEALKTQIDIPIDFIDERFSSAQADRMTGGEASRDEKAAMVILQTYFEKSK